MRDWWHEDRGMHIFVKIHCYAPFLLSVAAKSGISNFPGLGTLFKNNCKTEANRGILVDFRAKQPNIHHPSEARQSLACMPVLFIFLVNLIK
ncbi:hypothetical protein CsSME_00030178 [Camellia sinensis var. sinensis]